MNAAQSRMLLIGRLLLGLLFLVVGIRIILSYSLNIAYFTRLGFPAPEVITALAILIEVGGGTLLILGWQTRRVAWLLVIFVVIATAMAHRFWEFDSGRSANELNHFLKNMAIIGGLLYVIALGAGRLSLDERSVTS